LAQSFKDGWTCTAHTVDVDLPIAPPRVDAVVENQTKPIKSAQVRKVKWKNRTVVVKRNIRRGRCPPSASRRSGAANYHRVAFSHFFTRDRRRPIAVSICSPLRSGSLNRSWRGGALSTSQPGLLWPERPTSRPRPRPRPRRLAGRDSAYCGNSSCVRPVVDANFLSPASGRPPSPGNGTMAGQGQ
jgi:hypothetical protein